MDFRSSSGRYARSRHLAESHPQVLIIAPQAWSSTSTTSLDGTPNTALVDLAADLTRDLRPLLRTTDELPADLRGRDSWRGHLSLASHELTDRVDLREEVELFIRQLETPYPSGFEAATVTVYRLYRSAWSCSWWTDFKWEHGRSFSLARRASRVKRVDPGTELEPDRWATVGPQATVAE